MRSSYLKPSLLIKTEYVDKETGDILDKEEKKVNYLANTKEEFFLAYAQLFRILYSDMTLPEVKVYAYLLAHYTFGSLIGLSLNVKKAISDVIKIGTGTIDNALCGLTEKKLLYSSSRGVYKLNPRYAFKGSSSNRNQMLKVILELECENC